MGTSHEVEPNTSRKKSSSFRLPVNWVVRRPVGASLKRRGEVLSLLRASRTHEEEDNLYGLPDGDGLMKVTVLY
jgi:hypothetical protein